MRPELATSNLVVTANAFNPSLFRETWLRELDFLQSSLATGFVFSDSIAHVPTTAFKLIVIPPQLQLEPADRVTAPDLARDLVEKVLRRIPHTPFTGVGLNFVWDLDLEGEALEAATRRLFCPTTNPIANEFAGANANFGSYMSVDVPNARLKLDVKPVMASNGVEVKRFIRCAFNFHRDLAAEPLAVLEAVARGWRDFDTLAARLSHQICEPQ